MFRLKYFVMGGKVIGDSVTSSHTQQAIIRTFLVNEGDPAPNLVFSRGTLLFDPPRAPPSPLPLFSRSSPVWCKPWLFDLSVFGLTGVIRSCDFQVYRSCVAAVPVEPEHVETVKPGSESLDGMIIAMETTFPSLVRVRPPSRITWGTECSLRIQPRFWSVRLQAQHKQN